MSQAEALPAGMTAEQTADYESRARISKAVADIDQLCSISKLKLDEAFAAFAVITAIKLSELPRSTQIKWQKFFDAECKQQRRVKLQLNAQAESTDAGN